MLRDKLTKLAKLTTKKKNLNTRKLATSLDPSATPFLQTRRFFANNQEPEPVVEKVVEKTEEIVPVS